MIDTTAFQILVHMAEVVRLERQEFDGLDGKYRQEFNQEFADELKYLVFQKALPLPRPGDPGGPPPEHPTAVPQSTMKKLHRQLALATHPDRTGVEDDEEFKDIQRAYETGDITSLISACTRHDIKLQLDASEALALRNRIESQRTQMSRERKTAHWVWCTSAKTDGIRRQLWDVMNIDESGFEKWLESNGIVLLKELGEDEILVSFSVE